MSVKHLVFRMEELSRGTARCRLSPPRRQIRSKCPVISTHWLNNPFENELRDSDTLLRFLFLFLGSFWTHCFVEPLQLERELFPQHRQMEMNMQIQAFQIGVELLSAATGSFKTSDGCMFSDVLVESKDGSRRERPESHRVWSLSRCLSFPLHGSVLIKALVHFCHLCSDSFTAHPPIPAAPPPIVRCGNWVRAVALESLCNPHFISALIEVKIQYSLISFLLAVPLPSPLR